MSESAVLPAADLCRIEAELRRRSASRVDALVQRYRAGGADILAQLVDCAACPRRGTAACAACFAELARIVSGLAAES